MKHFKLGALVNINNMKSVIFKEGGDCVRIEDLEIALKNSVEGFSNQFKSNILEMHEKLEKGEKAISIN